ncbi:MAG: DUF302 domain-containing protein [Marinicaulis sp.]|nr:DUF302 domain-containing protein [Marinicaulis sp.]NNE41212.1 DUF302 domain-containing protein [Marinicaulis sp.]NNL88360.1 DUF302 domain-containing protein [Marinicaulis sp.]
MRPIALAAIPALMLAACATAEETTAPQAPMAMAAPDKPHIVTVQSNSEFDQTVAQLKTAIEARGFKTFAIVDHAKGAASIGEILAPTTLIIFGNPKGGTPLLQNDSRIGLEIPLRVLVRQANDGVEIIHEDMAHLFHEYGLEGLDKNLAGIEAALGAITVEAAAN